MNTIYNYDATYESPYQAWRTGFITSVTICLGLGLEDISEQIDYDNLNLWLNVGRDVDHGAWAIAGAQQGTYMSLLTQWDHSTVFKGSEVNEQELDALWQTVVDSNPDNLTALVSQELVEQLQLTILYMDARVSKFFKHYVLSNTQ